ASDEWQTRGTSLVLLPHPSLGSRTDRANECGYRDDHRPDRLPTREQNVSDFDWPAVPVKVAVSINAYAVLLLHIDFPNARRPQLLIRLPKRNLPQFVLSRAGCHGVSSGTFAKRSVN